MVNATLTPAVTETKVIEVSPARVVLDLSMEEADAIRAVLSRVTGNSSDLTRTLDPVYTEISSIADKVWEPNDTYISNNRYFGIDARAFRKVKS